MIRSDKLVRMLQLENIDMTSESLVKIERGIQRITGTQLRDIRDYLQTTYDDLLSESFNIRQCKWQLVRLRMKYMERRGSGLRKIVSETEKLPGYTEAYKPEFSSTATDFRVILKNVNYIMRGASVHDATHDTAHDAAHDTSVISKQNLLLEFCTEPKSRDESV